MSLKITLSGSLEPNEDIWGLAREAIDSGSKSVRILKNGTILDESQEITILYGPVIGNVTATSAIILVEAASKDGENGQLLRYKLHAIDSGDGEPIVEGEESFERKRPKSIILEGLTPSTNYMITFTNASTEAGASFKTKMEEGLSNFKLLALSCDRPSRLLLGQLNPWKAIEKIVKTGRVDCILHIGDQIYPDDENIQHAAKIFGDIYDTLPPSKQEEMMSRGRELWREKYRANFNKPYKKEVVANVSNLMIWSDNDVANDFTTLKNAGEQAYHPNFILCGMQVYREYQRQLWDPDCSPSQDEDEEVQEFHSHLYGDGQIGIFLFDLRGNRISAAGAQKSSNPLISEGQWNAFDEFISTPNLRAAILCSETPFIGEEPSSCIEKVNENPSLNFLRDHWYFNEHDLLRLVEACFKWKSEGDGRRDLILISGDIHCGVTSVITDEESGLQINHFTTSPVTNHVCEFFPPLMGSLSERFHFHHLPLGGKFRNFLDVDIHIDDENTSIQAKLVPVSTDVFKNSDWQN